MIKSVLSVRSTYFNSRAIAAAGDAVRIRKVILVESFDNNLRRPPPPPPDPPLFVSSVTSVTSTMSDGVTLFVEHFNARQAHVVWVAPSR